MGWLTILHFGPNREVYPFFDFSEKDPYNYRRTAISSLSTADSPDHCCAICLLADWFCPVTYSHLVLRALVVVLCEAHLQRRFQSRRDERVSPVIREVIRQVVESEQLGYSGLDTLRDYPELLPACKSRHSIL